MGWSLLPPERGGAVADRDRCGIGAAMPGTSPPGRLPEALRPHPMPHRIMPDLQPRKAAERPNGRRLGTADMRRHVGAVV
jgi:hypothetical protein